MESPDVLIVINVRNVAIVFGLTPVGIAWRDKTIVREPEETGEGTTIHPHDALTLGLECTNAGLSYVVADVKYRGDPIRTDRPQPLDLNRCEHGVPDGEYCEPCNREYKRAAREAGLE
jgi:hypothetical protein